MDECEYLCNRLAIMANGQLECIGPVQHLKNRYGKGFLLIVMVNADSEPLDISRVKAYMTDSFDCILREEYAVSKILLSILLLKFPQFFKIKFLTVTL